MLLFLVKSPFISIWLWPIKTLIFNDSQDEIIQLLFSNEFSKLSDQIDINGRLMKAIIDEEIEIFEQTALYMSIEKQNINAIKSLLARPDLNINEKSFHIKGNSQVEQKAA